MRIVRRVGRCGAQCHGSHRGSGRTGDLARPWGVRGGGPASPSPGSQLWAARYGTTEFENTANAVKVSPDGGTVFVTGSTDSPSSLGFATIAYDAPTGHRLWLARYNGPADGNDSAQAAAVSPTTGTVFVTAQSAGTGTMEIDLATVAYQG